MSPVDRAPRRGDILLRGVVRGLGDGGVRHLESMLAFHALDHGIGKRVVGRGGHDKDVLPDGDGRVKPWLVLRDHR